MDVKEFQKLITKMVSPLKRRVQLMIGRCILTTIDDSKGIQNLQITGLSGETFSNIERFQNYGFTSVPFANSEALVIRPNGSSDHSIVISVDDRRYRLKSLENGEVAIYDDQGSKVHLKRDGIIEIASNDVVVNCENATITASQTAEVEGQSVKLGTSAAEAVIKGNTFQSLFNAHTHNGNLGAPTGPPIVQLTGSELSTKVTTE